MTEKFRALGTGRGHSNSAGIQPLPLPFRLAGLSCIALFVSTALLWFAIDSWHSAQRDVQNQNIRLKQAQAKDKQSLQRVESADFARSFLAQAGDKKLMAQQWVGRSVDIRESRAKRKATAEFLFQAQSYKGQIFSAEEFDVAATDAAAGLFGDVTQDFQIVLKGRSMFRVSQ